MMNRMKAVVINMPGKFCVVVGHGKSKNGGYDSGAVSKDSKLHEFKIAREIARYAQQYYNDTYTEQADLMNYDGSLYLNDRIKLLNKNGYEAAFEVHLNSNPKTSPNGTEAYYSKGNKVGQEYADAICDNIAAALDVNQRGGKDADGGDKVLLNASGKDYFAFVRETDMTAVLIETVFISNSYDLDKVKTAEGQKACGIAIAKGIARVRNPKKKPAEIKPAAPVKTELYRVRKTWTNFKSQKGAYKKLKNAIAECKKYSGYSVYDSKGKALYTAPVPYYSAYTGKSTKVDEVFEAVGVPASYRGKWSKRKPIAKVNGITLYVGSAKQNTKLITLARKGKLKKP